MKRFGVALMTLLLVSAVTVAQPGNFNPERFAKRQTEQLKKEIDLNADQEKKVYELNVETLTKMGALREEMRKKGSKGMREKMRTLREKQNERMKEILTDDQWTKYEKYLEKRRSEMRERRRR